MYDNPNKPYGGYGNQRGGQYDQRRQQNTQYDFKDKPFFKEDGSINPAWLKEWAKDFSNSIANTYNGLSTTGLRNFFNEFLRIKNLPKGNAEEKRVLIRMLAVKVNYKKTTGKVPNDFVTFIEKLVDAVQDDIERFEKACFIMEAIIGYNPKK